MLEEVSKVAQLTVYSRHYDKTIVKCALPDKVRMRIDKKIKLSVAQR